MSGKLESKWTHPYDFECTLLSFVYHTPLASRKRLQPLLSFLHWPFAFLDPLGLSKGAIWLGCHTSTKSPSRPMPFDRLSHYSDNTVCSYLLCVGRDKRRRMWEIGAWDYRSSLLSNWIWGTPGIKKEKAMRDEHEHTRCYEWDVLFVFLILDTFYSYSIHVYLFQTSLSILSLFLLGHSRQ